MKNFREQQINSTDEYCINQYWEKEVQMNGIDITFYYWKRKEGCKGFDGRENILKVEGKKKIEDKLVRSSIKSIWSLNLGERYLIETMVSKFKGV
jgi:hypothetical protein